MFRRGSRGGGGGGGRGRAPPYFGPNLDFFKCKTEPPEGAEKNLDNGAPPLLKISGSGPDVDTLNRSTRPKSQTFFSLYKKRK